MCKARYVHRQKLQYLTFSASLCDMLIQKISFIFYILYILCHVIVCCHVLANDTGGGGWRKKLRNSKNSSLQVVFIDFYYEFSRTFIPLVLIIEDWEIQNKSSHKFSLKDKSLMVSPYVSVKSYSLWL